MHALTFCQRALQAVTSQSLPLGFRPEPLFLEYPFPRADNFDGANFQTKSSLLLQLLPCLFWSSALQELQILAFSVNSCAAPWVACA